MKKILLFFIFIIVGIQVQGQSEMDTLGLWHYQVDYAYSGFESDTVKAMGKVAFYRIKGVDDDYTRKHYGKPWKPSIAFDIYNISEFAFVKQESNKVHLISSCVAPHVGGDYFIVGDLILLNRSPCLSCVHPETKVHYCLPMVRLLISKLDISKIHSIDDFLQQLMIRK